MPAQIGSPRHNRRLVEISFHDRPVSFVKRESSPYDISQQFTRTDNTAQNYKYLHAIGTNVSLKIKKNKNFIVLENVTGTLFQNFLFCQLCDITLLTTM